MALAGSEGLPRLFTIGPPIREQKIDTATNKELMSRAYAGVTAMAFHPSQPLLVLALKSGGALLVDLTNGPTATLAHAEARYTALALSSEGDVVVMATHDRRVVMERTPVASAETPDRPEGRIAVDFEVRAIAAGPRGWPLILAGEDRVMVFARSPEPRHDGSTGDPRQTSPKSAAAAPTPAATPLEVRGPWPIPADERPQLALIEDDNMVAVLADGRLLLLHLETGLDLLREDYGDGRDLRHAALGAPRRLALLWGENRRQLMVHTFVDVKADAQGGLGSA